MRSFWKDRKGNFALALGLLTVPVFGAAGLSVDYMRATSAHSFFQDLADHAALSGALQGIGTDTSKITDYAKTKAEQDVGNSFGTQSITVNGDWVTPTDYQVTIRGTMPTVILGALPGFNKAVVISASAMARSGKAKYIYTAPKFSNLDPDAWDYNQIAVYCFNPEKADDPKTHGRTKETLIADNAGTTYNYTMPQCAAGQFLSFHLHNVREALHNAQNLSGNTWKNVSLKDRLAYEEKRSSKYDYYTDTTIENGREKYDLSEPILETVLCDTYDECKGKSKGGIIPEGANRTPQQALQACSTNKYLYYGWEDRPPSGGSDKDYNDIRVIMACPSVEVVGRDDTRLLQ